MSVDELKEKVAALEKSMKHMEHSILKVSIPRAILGGTDIQQSTIRDNIHTLIAVRDVCVDKKDIKAIDAKLVTLVAALGVPNIEDDWIKK